jgi:hypothetical protein
MTNGQPFISSWALKSAYVPDYQAGIISNFCLEMIHIGKEIQKRATEKRIGPTELGRMINTSKQNVYRIFKQKSLDTDQLQMISKALDFDFFIHYRIREHEENWKTNAERAMIVQEEKIEYLSTQNKVLTQALSEEQGSKKLLDAKEKVINELKQTIDKLKKEIERLRKKKV